MGTVKRRARSEGQGPLRSDRRGRDERSFIELWLANYLTLSTAQRFDVVDVNCSLVPADDHTVWYLVYKARRPYDVTLFEELFGRMGERFEHNFAKLDEAFQKKTTIFREHAGFHNVFVPVKWRGRVRAFLVAGPVSLAPLTADAIGKNWRALSGRDPSMADPEFRAYVAASLDTPVLDGALLAAFQSFMEGFARMMGSEQNAKVLHRREVLPPVVRLRRSFQMWSVAASLVNRQTHIASLTAFKRWFAKDLGVRRAPNTVLAFAIARETSTDRDPVSVLADARELQRSAIDLCHELGDTLCAPIGNQGLFVLTHTPPSLKRAEARVRLLELGSRFRQFARDRFRLTLRAGIGGLPPNEHNLVRDYDHAVLALQLAMTENRSAVFYSDEPARRAPAAKRTELYVKLQRLSDALAVRSLETARVASLELMREVFARAVGSFDATRAFLEGLFCHVLSGVERQIDGLGLDETVRDFANRLETATNVFELPSAFEISVARLGGMLVEPQRADKSARLDRARRYIDENFQAPLRLEEVARQNGFSRSQFSRLFKRHAGAGFSTYLLQARMTRARELLRTTDLPIVRVSREAGFRSYLYFFEAFRRENQMTPKRYRSTSVTPRTRGPRAARSS